MDFDPSFSKFIQPTQFSAVTIKRAAASDRTNSSQKQQRVNPVNQAAPPPMLSDTSAVSSAVAQISMMLTPISSIF